MAKSKLTMWQWRKRAKTTNLALILSVSMLSMLWITQRPQCKCSGSCSSKDRIVVSGRLYCISMPSKITAKWLMITHWASKDFRRTSSCLPKSLRGVLSRTTKRSKTSWHALKQLWRWPIRGKRWQSVTCVKISCTVCLRFLTRTMKWNGVRPCATSKNLDREATTSPLNRELSNSAGTNCPWLQTLISSRIHSDRIDQSIKHTLY